MMRKLTEAEKRVIETKIEQERLRRWKLMMLTNIAICGGCGKVTAFEIPSGEVMKVGSKFYMQGKCIHCKHIQSAEIKYMGEW